MFNHQHTVPDTSVPLSENPLFRHAISLCSRPLLGAALFSVVINLLMLAPAIYMLQVYDRVLPSGNTMTLAMLTLMVAGLFLFMAAMEWIRSIVVIRLSAQIDIRLNQQLFNAAFYGFLNNQPTLAGQAFNDLATLRQFATGKALFTLFDAPWFPLYLCVLFLIHPWLGWLALSGAVLLVLLAWLNQRRIAPQLKVASHYSAQASEQATTCLRQPDVILAMGMLDNFYRQWHQQHQHAIQAQNRASETSAAITAGTKCIRLLLQSITLGLGAFLALAGEITSGMIIAGSILTGRVLAPVDQLIASWRSWSMARMALQRIHLLLARYPTLQPGMPLPAPEGYLTAENLLYYPQSIAPPILNNISFSLMPGDVLGILGPSASGKTTLARMLVGVLAPSQGKLRLDGADLHLWDKNALGPFIGYLPQDIQLFSASVAEIIARGSSPDELKVIDAARAAGVHDMILCLPQGYDTRLGENGTALSGGQRQRIALARALYGAPSVIVLDEPDASLDEEGRLALIAAISAQKQANTTQIVITHKTALLACATKVLVLNSGTVSYFGPPDKILPNHTVAGAKETASSLEPAHTSAC